MSISFSGLASGLDTTSWVESLVALRQAKVEGYEEEKTGIESMQETLSNIKSFFSSFRSMIEKVTDSSFGIPTMDIFAQKLATSSDTSVLTAAASTEAEEGTYDVFVDKLATETQAISGLNTTTTIIETHTATLNSKLTSIGVRAGEIGVTVNCTKHTVTIGENDTIGDFINNLQQIGVGASYNENSGIFSISIDNDAIDDTLTVHDDGTVGTGIVEALNLSETSGYESGDLEISTIDTIVTTATGDTKLSALGVKAGTVKIEANDIEYSFQITNDSTIEEFVDAMQDENIDASFKDGVISIIDAEITDDGTTNLIEALGLESSVNHNDQSSGDMSYTEVKSAELSDKIVEFVPDGLGVINIFDKTGAQVGSVTVTNSTTFESLFDRLADFGIKGRVEDGVVSISSADGNYVSGGLMDKLGVGVVTTTITTTSGSGISSDTPIDYDSVYQEKTTIYATTTLTTTSTSAVDCTSSGILTYSTVVTSTKTETVPIEMTSSSGVYYTKLVTTTNPGGGDAGGGDAGGSDDSGYSSMSSGSAIYVTNKTSNSLGSNSVINPEINVTDTTLLNAAITNYDIIGIGSAEVLAQLAATVNSGADVSQKTFVLTADIDLSGYSSWTSIGNSPSNSFQGTFDGQGHVITGLTNSLFGYTKEAAIRNVGIENANISVNAQYTGGLIGYATYTEVSNSYVNGSVSSANFSLHGSSESYSGGLIGATDNSTITQVYTSANSSSTGFYNYVGGIIGYVAFGDNSIQTAIALGQNLGRYTGGIIGAIDLGKTITVSGVYYNSTDNSSAGNVKGTATGVEASKFTADYIQAIGFTDANGWMYTDSSALPVLKAQNLINSETTLKELLGDGCSAQTVVIQTSSGIKNIVISADDSILEKLAEAGIEASIEEGKLLIDGGGEASILSVSSALSDALHLVGTVDSDTSSVQGGIKPVELTSTEAIEYRDNNDDNVYTDYILRLVNNSDSNSQHTTTLGRFGVSTTNYITVQNGSTTTTIVVDSNTYFSKGYYYDYSGYKKNNEASNNLVQMLEEVGIKTYVTNGKVSFVGDNTHYILGMTADLRVALNMDSGVGYTVISDSTSGGESSGGSTSYISTIFISSSASNVALSSVGVNTTNYITVQNGATTSVVTVDASTTVNQLASALAAVGIKTDVTNGKFTFTGDSTHYITGITTNLKSALNLMESGGVGYTVRTVETSSTQTVTLASANTDIQLGAFGVSGSNFITVQNGTTERTISVDGNTSLSDMVSLLANAGIAASVSGGKLTLSGDDSHYILGMTSNLANALKLSTGNGKTYTTTTNKTTVTTPVETTVNVTQKVQMSEDTKFSQLGLSGNQTIIGVQNGKNFTISITASDTVGDILNALGDYGITASVRGGKIYINPSDDAFITNMSSGIKSALNITAAIGNNGSYTITTIKTYANTAPTNGVLDTVTATAAVTRDTALSDLGVTSGEFNIWVNGVKYTALISSDETVGEFLDTLEEFGIQTSIVNNGNSSIIKITGNGNAYIAKSAAANGASNVVDILFPGANNETTYNYEELLQIRSTVTTHTTATEDTLLSEFDTEWGGSTLKSAGNLVFDVNGQNKTLRITETETIGSFMEKLENAGITASFNNGKLYIYGGSSIVANGTTSSLGNPNAGLQLTRKNNLDGMMFSTATVEETKTIIEEHTASAASYADLNTKLSTLNITGGTFTVYRNGEKILLNIEADDTFNDIRSMLASKYSDLDLKFEDGYLVFYSKDDDVSVEVGNTTDTSNFLAVTGLNKNEKQVRSARALYTVNSDSLVTADGIFRAGKVTTGSFTIGTAKINIDANTTIADIVSQINNNEDTNATAYWDSIDGKLVIESRSSGSALINIEAGTSNFTDIMGYTTSEWNSDGTLKSTRMNVETQTLGSNAQFRINGTTYTASSNTITSDITRLKGVTLNLNGLTAGSSVKVTVEKDKESVATALSDVVDSYNELMKNVDEALSAEGQLHNQTTLKMIRNQLRSLMTSSDMGATVFRNLDAIGISVDSASASNISTSNESIISLSFDKDKFLDAYEADADAVKALLIGGKDNKGIFTQVETLLENALQSVSGYFAITEKSYQRQITNLNNKITKENNYIEKYRARLEKKFSSMDLLIGQMQQQYSSFLSF